ncbi:unnamed protein product [Peniophora sp. CBMAI 1063]|nr:unnamed protein product [Peniophora sp. CBMAI 1063]
MSSRILPLVAERHFLSRICPLIGIILHIGPAVLRSASASAPGAMWQFEGALSGRNGSSLISPALQNTDASVLSQPSRSLAARYCGQPGLTLRPSVYSEGLHGV